jgi:uncharacterized protein (TIGR03118 family)
MVSSSPIGGTRRPRLPILAVASAATLAAALVPAPAALAHDRAGDRVQQVNLVADLPGAAAITDPNLVNAWGLSAGPTTPLWVSDNGADAATLYRGGVPGTPASIVPLVVAIPDGAPTGQVFNDTTGFVLGNGQPARFVFASENGSIDAWNPQLVPSTSAVTTATTKNAVYKGLALLHRDSGPWLLATNFHAGRIDVFDQSFHQVRLGHDAFADDDLPRGYAPFGIAVLDGQVFVSYAQQDAAGHDDVAGPGHGFVEVFNASGRLVRHLVRRGALNSPWGLTIAPSGFGDLAGTLLVGNFGDGRLHAYDPRTGHLRATLRDASGHPLQIDGLWGLLPGNGVAGPTSDVWFSAGPDGEQHGLLGLLAAS